MAGWGREPYSRPVASTAILFSAMRRRLIVGVALGACLAAVGCGGTDTAERSGKVDADQRSDEADKPDQGSDNGSSVTQSNTAEGGSVSQSNKLTQRSGSGSSSVSSSQSTSGGNAVQRFSGTGTSSLTFNVDDNARLSWRNQGGGKFSATGGDLSIDSRAGHGELKLEPGRYEDIKVRGQSWTIVVRSR